ncbi:hypothetical protein A8L59_16350 [Pseudomonas koreensis]|uniref:DUF4145 domain-containing protein n=1 Tax=Pseudomonas koreensis TaxID=198620 RepID=A0AAC9BV42_9PSED|nr:DUF4145 domain-containing protein [Pseudomonas koreensis]ANH98919.1 hypothetical protein A8L59_16350 [Pseudomonas koreensis]
MFSGMTDTEVHAKCFELIQAENDRGAALLAAVFAEATLESLILDRLIPNSGKQKLPVNNFAAKIDLSFRLGIIPEGVANLLHGLRDIRNIFAHQIISDFETASVATKTEAIFKCLPEHYARFIERWSSNINEALKKHNVEIQASAESIKLRVRFNNYFAQTIMDLNAIQKTNKRLETVY